ncbi:uncharacterized protein [Euwallacea fornicatus]|uniref:uncharacterized protein isoform X3 n=1 Tax=Euwallacea fornicatus TaxID=995702 RepID=UPI00338EDA75
MIHLFLLIFCQVVSFFSMTEFELVRLFAALIYFYFFISLICLTYIMDIEHLTESKRRNCWQFDRAGLELKQDILKLTRTIEFFLLLACVILILFWVPYIGTPKNIRRADYSVILMGQYVPHLEPIYMVFLISLIVFLVPMCISWILHFMYFSWQVQLQALMLTKFVRDLGVNISDDFCMAHCGVVLNRYYQHCIWTDLIFIIHRHTELLSYHREVKEDLRTGITSLLLGIAGTCLCLTGMYTAILEHEVRAGTLMPVFLIILEILCFSAQAHEDRFFTIFHLASEAPWYKWDIKNRKAYLLLIRQSSQLVSFPFFNARVNRTFQFDVLKIVYSAMSVLMNFYC